MKTKKQSAFSLIEILLVLAIIGVVTVLGLSVSRKSTERAYRNYIYTGYVSLQNAIADARNEQQDILIFRDFVEHIANLLSAKIELNGEDRIITAPNGIKYRFYINPYNFTQVTGNHSLGNNVSLIKMTVPTQRGNNQNSICVVYAQDFDNGFLVPTVGILNNDGIASGVLACNSDDTDVLINDFNTRIDLLAFYADNGLVGRVKQNASGNVTTGGYQKLYDYKNMQDMFCESYGAIQNITPGLLRRGEPIQFITTPLYACNNLMPRKQGIIRVANPNKIF